MDFIAALATLSAVPFACVVVLAVLNRRTILRRTNDGSDQGAEEGWGVVNHNQPNSAREQHDHA